jgi:hypothetical protein
VLLELELIALEEVSIALLDEIAVSLEGASDEFEVELSEGVS